MAGPMTHMMVSQMASDRTKVATIDKTLQDILLVHQPFLALGSVGPDLPAIIDATPFQSSVSDRMHDGNTAPRIPTNTTVRELYRKLKGGSADCAPFAFLLGWVSHTVADVMIHPAVNIVVNTTSISHRACETYQDTLLFYKYRHANIKRNDFLTWLTMCNKRPGDLRATIELWQPIVNQYYGGHDCKLWVSSYETAFSIARELIHIDSWSYPSPAQITADEVEHCYSGITLPVTNGTGHFDDVFWSTVNVTAHLWQQIYQRFIDPSDHRDITDLDQDWDLNTGLNNTTGRTFDLWR